MTQLPDNNDGLVEPVIWDPLQEPHWRWLQVLDVVAKKLPEDDIDDVYVRKAVSYWKSYKTRVAKKGESEESLAKKYTGIHYAYKLFRQDNCDLKWIIEARILADEAPEIISKKCKTHVQIIEWYEKLFFDVRDKLDSKDYILSRVIQLPLNMTVSFRRPDILWKLVGYTGGASLLDQLLQHRYSTDLEKWLHPLIKFSLATKTWFAIQTASGENNLYTLLDSYTKNRSLDNVVMSSDTEYGQMVKVAQMMMEAVQQSLEQSSTQALIKENNNVENVTNQSLTNQVQELSKEIYSSRDKPENPIQ